MIGICSNPTHNEFKGEEIDLDTFEYKGCWRCSCFEFTSEDYMYVPQAAEKFGVTESTIRKWCRNGKLEAYKCTTHRWALGPPSIWLIDKVFG